MEVKIMFKDHDTPVWYLVDRDNTKLVTPKQFKNDRNAGFKMIKENNNNLSLTWKPQKGSPDYDYHKTAAPGTDVPLGFIKILQHDLDAVKGTQGCHMLIKMTLACRGLKDQTDITAPTASQQQAIDLVIN
jgi:hypothetical protein